MKDDPALSFQIVDHGQSYGHVSSTWPLAETLTRRVKRVMHFITKHYRDKGQTYIYDKLVDNYTPTNLKLHVKQSIISILIDLGLIYTTHGDGDTLDVAKYKYVLHTEYQVPRKELDERKLEKFIFNCLVEAQRMFRHFCYLYRRLPRERENEESDESSSDSSKEGS